jgi:hypothetical protein
MPRRSSPTSGSPIEFGPSPFETFRDAAIALVFASVDEEELGILEKLADEHRKNHYSTGTLWDQYILPVYSRLDRDLAPLDPDYCDGPPAWSGVESASSIVRPVLLPAGPEPSRQYLEHFLAGGSNAKTWAELREVLVVALRMELYFCDMISGKVIEVSHLRRARSEVGDFLEMLIAHYDDSRRMTRQAREELRQQLSVKMDKWVAENGSVHLPSLRLAGFDSKSGKFTLTETKPNDFWIVLMVSLCRLQAWYGSAGVRRCPRCKWFFHPALWLNSRVKGVDFCSQWCKREQNNSKRPKKR